MSIATLAERKSIYGSLGGEQVINNIVDSFYDNIMDDYRVSRLFNSIDMEDQKAFLKNYLVAAFGDSGSTDEDLENLLNDYFMVAFARHKEKSFVNESDFGFFGMIIEQDHPSKKYLCPAHSHLLKFIPEDSHYDAVIESLNATLDQLGIDSNSKQTLLSLAENARSAVLGK